MTADLKPNSKQSMEFLEFNAAFVDKLRSGKIIFTFDLDQVLINTAEAVLKKYNLEFKDTKKWDEDVLNWWPLTPWLMEHGLSFEDAQEKESQLWSDPKILEKAEPLSGSFWFMRNMLTYSLGNTHVITSRDPGLRNVTFRYLEQQLGAHPFFMRENIWIREDRSLTGEDFKIKVIQNIHPGSNMQLLHIDDSPDVCLRIQQETSATPILLQSTFEIQKPDNYPYAVIPRREGGQFLWDIYNLFLNRKINLGI